MTDTRSTSFAFPALEPLDPDMPDQELRLHMGELTAQEMRVVRAAIRLANAHWYDLLEELDE